MHRLAWFAVLLAVAAGCGGVFTERDHFKQAIEEYNGGLRWGKVDASCAHLPLAQRQAFAERFASLADDLQVMDYEVQRINWDRSTGKAEVRVDVSWSLKRRGLLERTVLSQHWEEQHGAWVLASQSRIAGSPLPLLDEPPPAPPATR